MLRFLVVEVIVVVILILLLAAEIFVLVVGGMFLSFLLSSVWRRKRQTRPIVNLPSLIVLPIVFFVFSLATAYFIPWFLGLVLVFLTFDSWVFSSAPFLWAVIALFLIFEFVSLSIAGNLASGSVSRLGIFHALAVAVLYEAIWRLYFFAFPTNIDLPLWVTYLEYVSMFAAVVLGSWLDSQEEKREAYSTSRP